jgi:hypothetical protein
MNTIINIADIKDPNDVQGRSYREVNRAKTHVIPVGSLVELSESGVRLFVVKHSRDCDQTPLYELCSEKEFDFDAVSPFRGLGYCGAYSADSLTVIR